MLLKRIVITISLAIVACISSSTLSASQSDGDALIALMNTDYYVLDKKEKKQYEKDLEIALKSITLSEILLLDESVLEGKALEIFQAALEKQLKNNKTLSLLPVDGTEVVISQVVSVEGATQQELFRAAQTWATGAVFFRKIGGEQNSFMMLGGQQTHPIMGQLEASMRSRAVLLGSIKDEMLHFRLYQYLQTKGMTIRTLMVDSNVTLQFRDDRYRIVIDDMKYDHYNHYTGNQQRFYLGGDCQANGTMFEFQNVCSAAEGARREALIQLQSDRKKFVADLIKGIESNLLGSPLDDW